MLASTVIPHVTAPHRRGPASMDERPTIRRGVITRLAYAVLATGCSLIAGFDLEAQLQVRDSLGVMIVGTDGQRARAVSQVTVQGEPELQIGELDGAPAYLFSGIAGVALLPRSRVLVVDGSSAELRFYDLEGEFIRRQGGLGDGPGEFRRPRFLNTTAGDSLLIWDGRARRFTLYSSEGDGSALFVYRISRAHCLLVVSKARRVLKSC